MKKIVEIINSIYFIILINIIAVVFWYFQKPMYTYIIYLVLCIAVILLKANRVAIASIIMSSIIAYQVDDGNYLEFHSIYAKLFIPLGLVVISLFIYDIIRRKKPLKFSQIFYGFLSILIVNILSLINVRGKDLFFIALLGVLQLFGYLLVYTYLLNAHDKDGKVYISNIALITATAITVQLVIHYLTLGSVSNKGDNDLSWAVSNSIAMFYLALIPIGLYNYFRNQKNFIVLLVTGFNFFMMMFMLSRGAYFSLAIIIIPAVILCIFLTKDKKRLMVDTISTLLICLTVAFTIGTKLGLIEMVIDYFKDIDFLNDSGREELYIIGWSLFKEYPIFGAGSYSGAYYLKDHYVGTYHNFVIQTIATTGLLGIISLLYYLFTVIKTSLKKNIFNLLFLISFIYLLIHGIVDNSIYNPIIMIFLSTTMPFLEHYHENLEDLEVN